MAVKHVQEVEVANWKTKCWQTTWQVDIRVGVKDTFSEFFVDEYEYSSKYEYLGLLISRQRSVVVANNHVAMRYGRHHCQPKEPLRAFGVRHVIT